MDEPTYTDEKGNKIESSTMVRVIDIQRNNKILTALTIAVYIMILIVLWGIWKILSTGAVNTYIAQCVG